MRNRCSASTRRGGRVAGIVLAAVLPLVVSAGPAFALDDGEVRGKPLGTGLVIAIYIMIPVGVFLVLAFLSSLPSMLRRPRYRPGRAWKFDPLWFSGPDAPAQALRDARPGATARGGASAEW